MIIVMIIVMIMEMQTADEVQFREGFKKKKREKVWSFAKPGGGVSGGGEKTKLLF